MGGENSAGDLLTMRTLKKRRSQIISKMTSAIYREQRKLPPALRHAFLGH